MTSPKYKSLFGKKLKKETKKEEIPKEKTSVEEKLEIENLKNELLRKLKNNKVAKKAALIIKEMIKSNKD